MAGLLTADKLVVNQKPKVVELTNQYLIYDAQGNQIGHIQQEGQSKLRKALRLVTDVDQYLTHRLAVYDHGNTKLLQLTRPAKVFKSRVVVEDGSGAKVGEIVQKKVFGKIHFDMVGAMGQPFGQIQAENWRAWDFAIVDEMGREVGRIDKKFVGVVKAIFTPADNYEIDISPELTGDRRILAVAAAVAVDTALKQDARGFSVTDVLDV
jgi:uncharacterized protein YxjI